MVKLSIKPIWIVTIVLLGAWAIALKLALAIPLFVPGIQPVGYVAQDDITNYNLTSGHEILYRAQYEREYWGGNLIAYGVNSTGDIATATQPWNGGAAYQLDLQGANRRIVTLKSDGSQIPFTWASLSTVQQGNLTSSAVLDYLRGVRTGEVQQGGTLRQRASALGDIVHSRPYYLSDSASATPAPTVFVGANDGMLHAFDAATGAERWAYVPSMLIPKMSALSLDPGVSISFPHDYYVDGSVNVATILSGSKRVLVGALGAGGKGLFALDITGSARLAPADEASAATNILWEITPTTLNNAANSTYANLGYTYANPTIAKVSGVDAVIVGNGYNNGGNYQAYLYLINANTGALISAIQAGTSGTSGSPNGLSTPVAIDSNNDGNVDTVYAGDLNGTMWKFDLTPSTPTATALLITSPAQPITMTPGVARHPNGGYMINFVTGAMLAAADQTDMSVFAAYGIWDGAPSANTALLTQTLTERCYTSGTSVAATPCASRVRTVTSNQPDWTAGASHHKGWKVTLPTSEKVVGDGSYIEGGRFYFTFYNPTISTTVQSSTVNGENWLMELDYLSGGVSNLPFLDLNGDHVLNDDDRVKDSANPPAPVMTTDGIPVGKLIGIGVMSQPILVQLSTLNNTLFNQNPDVAFSPVALGTQTGVTGGHFDVDYFYVPPTGGAQASATITVGTTGQTSGYPATLGAITVNGVTIVPALTVADITDGYASSTNAATIISKVTGGFTATKSKSGYVITIKAPMGTQFNGKAISIAAGTSQTLVKRPQSGWTNFAPALTATAFNNNGAEAASVGDTCVDSRCKYDIHFHQYDKVFDVTGVNLLNPSSTTIDIKKSIPSLQQNFKVLVQNQYLSPAVELHIGDPTYLYNVDHGYIRLKDYATSATLDLATLQTYRRDPNAVWPGSASTDAQKLAQPKPIGSFTFNMPIDALSAKDWWGNGDVRAGLHPTVYSCVWQAAGSNDGNMYQPVIPPANGVDGPGAVGWSSSTTPTTATGARHNGALVIQIIRDTTPNLAIEQNVAGRPEYGWRIKSGDYSKWVLAEYATYWHHPNGQCYNSSRWTKTPPADTATNATQVAKAAGSTDPKIGNLAGSVGGAGGTITSVDTKISGAVSTTTITYSDGTSATIVRTANADGSVTIVTTDALKVVTTETIANTDGTLKTGGDERARQAARTGRISWRELVAP